MSKTMFAMLLGGVLGVFDGLSAWVSTPQIRPEIVGIVIGSTIKGVLAGLIIGMVAKRTQSMAIAVTVGVAVGACLALIIYFLEGQYFWEIVLPGATVGLIVGFAAFKYGGSPSATRVATR
jgi:hypothetical protein